MGQVCDERVYLLHNFIKIPQKEIALLSSQKQVFLDVQSKRAKKCTRIACAVDFYDKIAYNQSTVGINVPIFHIPPQQRHKGRHS